MNKKNKKKLFEGKNKWVIISTIIFGILGIVALVLGFGIANGFDSVLRWFGSRWAIYIYILAGFMVFVILWLWFRKEVND